MTYIWQGSAKGYFQEWIHDDLALTLFILIISQNFIAIQPVQTEQKFISHIDT